MNNRETVLLSALIVTTIMVVFLTIQVNSTNIDTRIADVDTTVISNDPDVISTVTPTTVTPIPVPTERPVVSLPVQIENYDDHIIFNMEGTYEFDKHTDISYPYARATDIDEEMTIMMWFRRDIFNTHQFLISKGQHGDCEGWRLMVKETKPPYQYEQIQFDVGNGKYLNYYKSQDGIVDHEWHSLVILFNANKIYVDSKGVETHGVIILDGKTDYYMACPAENKDKPPISDVTPYIESMYIGKHFDQKNKYYFTGAMDNVTILDVDIGIDAAQDWHDNTKVYIG